MQIGKKSNGFKIEGAKNSRRAKFRIPDTKLTVGSLDVNVDSSLQIAEAFHVPQKCRSLTRPTAANTALVGLRTTKIHGHHRDLRPQKLLKMEFAFSDARSHPHASGEHTYADFSDF